MTDTHLAPTAEADRSNVVSRFVGVLFSPRETFAIVVRHPRWLGMLALITIVTAICTGGFMFTDVGQIAALDQQVSTLESFGMDVTDEMYEQMERRMQIAPYTTGISILVFTPLVTVIVAGILFAVFNVGMGGEASFRQVLAVVVHAGAITAVQQVFVVPLNYLRESMSSPTNLSVFFPMLAEDSFLVRVLGMIDLFYVWWVIVLAIGLSVLYKRRTGSIATGLFIVYGLIVLGIAGVLSLRS